MRGSTCVDYERLHVGCEGDAPDCHQSLLSKQSLVRTVGVGKVRHVFFHGHERAERQVHGLKYKMEQRVDFHAIH